MSDPASSTDDITQQIMQSPDRVWKRLRDALKVQTREEAVRLVGSDDRAAETARTILASSSETVLTRPTEEARSLLGQAAAPRKPAEEVLYGRTTRARGRLTI